ncbi:MAG: VWA domain-containing protein [Myxococcales bacterium]|nr:MAG: VWA domain-containing protein [Myxococcales bacterium]
MARSIWRPHGRMAPLSVMTTSPLTIDCLPTTPALRAGQEVTLHVLVRLRVAVPEGRRPRPRLTTVLALDVSGSMGGQPLEHVIRSTERIVELLEDGDSVGLVAFSSAAVEVAPLQTLAPGTRRALQKAVRGLRAEGGTNIAAGLQKAAKMFPERRAQEQQMTLLLSDGQPNVGPSSARELGAEASQLRSRHIAVSTLGYGSSHDEKVLINMAEMGGGRYAFVSEPQLAEGSFVQALGAQLDVVVEGPRLTLTPCEDADIVRVLGDHRTSVGADGLRVSLRDLVAGEELSVLVEMKLRAWREGSWRALYATLSGAEPGGATVQQQAVATVEVSAQGAVRHDLEAVAAVAVALAEEQRTRARAMVERGDLDGAIAWLQHGVAAIEQTPGFVAGQGHRLNDAHEALVDDVSFYQKRPDMERSTSYGKAQQDYLSLSKGISRKTMSPSTQMMEAKRRAMSTVRARLIVLSGPGAGQQVVLDQARTVIGRSVDSDLAIHSEQLSRRHAIVEQLGDEFWVVDLGSTNGITLGGKLIQRRALVDGDVLEIGETRIQYRKG